LVKNLEEDDVNFAISHKNIRIVLDNPRHRT